MGLLERIEEIRLENNWSQRQFAREAKLENEGNLGVTYGRLRRNPNAQIEHSTLVLLARAGGVSVDWLASGDGPKYIETHIERPHRYPNFMAAAEFLRDRVPPEVINSVVEVFKGADLDRETWRVKILAAAADAKAEAAKTPERKATDKKVAVQRKHANSAEFDKIAADEEAAMEAARVEFEKASKKKRAR